MNLSYAKILKPEQITLEGFWNLYASMIFKDSPVGEIQYSETKKAFFAGFTECFKVISDMAGEYSEEQCMEIMDRLAQESRTWIEKEVAATYASQKEGKQ